MERHTARTEKTQAASPGLPKGIQQDDTFMLPVRGNLTSRFGSRIHPILRTRRFHDGIDIAAPGGTRVAASADGVVVSKGWGGAYGNLVKVRHGNGVETWYAHLSSANVTVGQRLHKGETLGRVGSTGWSTGDHLHFSIRVNGHAVNPLAAGKLRVGDLSTIKFPEIPENSPPGEVSVPTSAGFVLLQYLSRLYSPAEPACGPSEEAVDYSEPIEDLQSFGDGVPGSETGKQKSGEGSRSDTRCEELLSRRRVKPQRNKPAQTGQRKRKSPLPGL